MIEVEDFSAALWINKGHPRSTLGTLKTLRIWLTTRPSRRRLEETSKVVEVLEVVAGVRGLAEDVGAVAHCIEGGHGLAAVIQTP